MAIPRIQEKLRTENDLEEFFYWPPEYLQDELLTKDFGFDIWSFAISIIKIATRWLPYMSINDLKDEDQPISGKI